MAPRKTAAEIENVESAAPAEETAKPRVFQLRADATIGEEAEPVHRVSFGCAPRVSLGPGERFETTDPWLADALAADPLLEEVST